MKKISLLLIFVLLSISIFSNGTNNPRDEIYNYIDNWRNRELIDRLPPIRPYSAQYIVSLLEKIMIVGNEKDREIAENYIEKYSNYNLDFVLKHNSWSDLEDYNTISGLGAEANLPVHKYVHGNMDINAYLLNESDGVSASPIVRSPGVDYVIDNMHIDALGTRWYMYQGLNMNASFGTDRVWLQTGMMPTSFGPLFSDSVVVNPNAIQAAHYSLTWIHDLFTFSNLFMPIVATDNTGSRESASDDKYIHIKSLDFKFTDFWEFQFYETAIYGGKGVKPIFFLPFSEFFYSAGQGGTWDVNSIIGLSSRFKLRKDLSLTGTAYVDDVNAIEFAKLNFDNGKLKMAAQGEIAWTPEINFLEYIKLSYTAITPFMYTHITETPTDSETFGEDDQWDIRHHALSHYMNYENYTNYGKSMGPYGMDPNSDKIALNFSFNLPKGFKVKVNGEFYRHGDASYQENRDPGEDLNGLTDHNGDPLEPITTDGSIFDPGYGWEDGYLYNNSNDFLTQDVIETILLGEVILLTPEFNVSRSAISGELNFSYIYIDNLNLIEGESTDDFFIKASVNYRI